MGGGGGGGGACGAALSLGAAAAEPDEVVLQVRPGQELEPIARSQNLTLIAQFGSRPIYRLRVGAGDTVDAAVARLQADVARVMFAEPNLQGQSPESRRCSVWTIGEASAYTAQWAPDALRLAQAQALSRGAGVRVAVLDTGVELDHPSLRDRLARTPGGELLGRDFVNPGTTPAEDGDRDDAGYGHGTHVAGLVALAAPEARIMPVRVLDQSGQGNVWVLAEALLWAVDPDNNPATDDGAHVVNFSLGTLRPTKLLEIAARLASCEVDDDDDEDDFEDGRFDGDRARCVQRYGATVLAAAGNGGSETEEQFPAAEVTRAPIPGALAVTASTEARQLASFANRGAWIQVAAPGEGITSAVPGGGYGTWSGTSMASPLTAGVAALLIASGQGPDPQGFTGLYLRVPESQFIRFRTKPAPASTLALVGDLSVGGLFVRSGELLLPGTIIELDFNIVYQDRGYLVRCRGQVAWVARDNQVSPLGPGFGIKFIDPPGEVAALIEQIVEARAKELGVSSEAEAGEV